MSDNPTKKPKLNHTVTWGVVALAFFVVAGRYFPLSVKNADGGDIVFAIWIALGASVVLGACSVLVRMIVEHERMIIDPLDGVIGIEAAIGLSIWFLVLEWIENPDLPMSEPVTVGLAALLASCEATRRSVKGIGKKPAKGES